MCAALAQPCRSVPGVWHYSPKQHDFHSINIEDIAFRSSTEMVLGLRAPLVSRTTGNAYYFVATDLSAAALGPDRLGLEHHTMLFREPANTGCRLCSSRQDNPTNHVKS